MSDPRDRTRLESAKTQPNLRRSGIELCSGGARDSQSALRASRRGEPGVIVIHEEGLVVGVDARAEKLLSGCEDLFVEHRRLRCRSRCALDLFRAIRVAARTSPTSGFRSTFRFAGKPPVEVVVVPPPNERRRLQHALLLLWEQSLEGPPSSQEQRSR